MSQPVVPLVTGVVLAGGRSRRMGVDKASIRWGGLTLLERAVHTLQIAGCGSVLVLHRRPVDVSAVGVPVLSDLAGGEGPLDGLVTALTVAETPVVVTLPVDLPRLDPGDVSRLIERLVGLDPVDVIASADDRGTRQHLAAAWRREHCLEVLRVAFERGERAVHRAIGDLVVEWTIVASDHLLNVNTPEDLDTARRGAPRNVLESGS